MRLMNHLDVVHKVFREIKFSEQRSNHRTREENSYMYFLEYLDICEKGKEHLNFITCCLYLNSITCN